jgi:hypothetical protein
MTTITPKDLRNAANDLRVAPCLRRASDRIIAARLDWAAARIEELTLSAHNAAVDIGAVAHNLIKMKDKK